MTKQRKSTDLLAASGAVTSAPVANGERWELWTAEYPIVLRDTVRHHIFFFNREFRIPEVTEAAAHLTGLTSADYTVVVRGKAPGNEELARIRKQFDKKRIVTASQFLFSSLRNALVPADVLSGQTDYFIEPSVRFPSELEPSQALRKLEFWLRGEDESFNTSGNLNVAVLLAPAGVGKTTLVEQLFRRLLSRDGGGVFPLLLKREQWESLRHRGSVQLSDIWHAAVDTCYPRSLLGPDNLETYLAAGTIVPIFDGLDELCSDLAGDFSASKLIGDLVDTFDEGRLLVTSRTQYWNENLENGVRSRVLELELSSFSSKQRDQYLQKRFPDRPDKRAAAQRLLNRIGSRIGFRRAEPKPGEQVTRLRESDSSANLGFPVMPYVVMLAAESVDGKQGKNEQLLDEDDPITGLLVSLCDRESYRQRLSLGAQAQYRLLEFLAVEMGYSFDGPDIEAAASYFADNIPRGELERLQNHALLRAINGLFRFRYDFVQEHLVAGALRGWLLGRDDPFDLGVKALRKCADRPAALLDRWQDLVRGDAEETIIEALAGRWKTHRREAACAAGMSHLILTFVRAVTPGDRTAASRILLRIVGTDGRRVAGIRVRGSLVGLDLSDVHFTDCHFTDAELKQCTFSQKSRFEGCVFEGRLVIEECRGFVLAEFPDCQLSASAAATMGLQRDNPGKLPVTQDQIVEAMRETLRLFTVGTIGFRPVNVPRLKKHLQSCSFGDRLLSKLVKEGVLERTRLGVAGDGNRYEVMDQDAAKQFLNNSVRLRGVRATVVSLLEIDS